jgi:hypothetical protein
VRALIRTIVGVVSVFLCSGPAVAAPHYGARSRLTLSYLADAGYAAAVKLDCHPAGGGHPKAPQACAVLDAADGDPGKIPDAGTLCYLIYAPVDAEMTGTWHGRAVDWKHRYGNICEMRRATGVLFDF